MGSVNVSQEVDYEGYASEYAYATISWDEGPVVTVELTYSNVLTWRIRGRGSDTKEYCVGTGGARTGTFNAEDGKDYVFQIYSQTYNTYSDGYVFTVDFGNGGGGGDGGDNGNTESGGGNSSTTRTLYLEEGKGTSLYVQFWASSYYEQWKGFEGNETAIIHYNNIDTIRIVTEALDGYELNYYDVDGYLLGYRLENLEYYMHDPEYPNVIYFRLASDADARVISSAHKIDGDIGDGVNGARTLYLEQGEGTALSVNFTNISHYDQWEEFSGNTSAIMHYNGQDMVFVNAEVLNGYEIDYYEYIYYDEYSNEYEVYQLPYKVENLVMCSEDDEGYYFELASDADARIISTAHKIGEGGNGDSGGDSGGGSSSGSGILYFEATQYGAEYAVEYHYDNSTFYVDSVKVKLTQYASVWWAFNLTTKINDTTIYSGTENHFIDTFDWYDLGISGSANIADEVKISLTGSAIHNSYQFNVASPTSQTVKIGSGGGDSGNDDDGGGSGSGGSDGANSSLKSYTVTALGVTAKVTYTSGPEVTITIKSWDGYNSIPYWRVKGVKSEGDDRVYLGQNNKSSNSFNADGGYNDGGKNYIFQVCKNGSWGNDSGNDSKFHVDFSLGGSGGSGSEDTEPCGYFTVNQGEGTILKVRRSYCHLGHEYEDDGFEPTELTPIHYDDVFYIEVTALDGYELDYYEDDVLGLVPYKVENLEYYKTTDSINHYLLISADNASATSTATKINTATANIYSSSGWNKYALHIYSSSGWNKYAPYIYNGSEWNKYV